MPGPMTMRIMARAVTRLVLLVLVGLCLHDVIVELPVDL